MKSKSIAEGMSAGIVLAFLLIAGGYLIRFGWDIADINADKGDQVQFYTDPGTACEYLISPNGTLVPRIGDDYMQGGCDPQEDY